MIGVEDAPYTFEYASHFKILPSIYNWSADPARINGGCRVADNFTYTSDQNSEWMPVEQLQAWIAAHSEMLSKA